MGGKSRLHRDLIPDRPARSQSLYRLSYAPQWDWFTFFLNDEINYPTKLKLEIIIANFQN